MQKIKVENLKSKIVLVFLILWGAASFFVFPTLVVFQWAFLLASLLAISCVFYQKSSYIVLIQITFSSAYFFYGLEFAYGLPLWIIISGLAVFLFLEFWFLGKRLVVGNENFNLVVIFFIISILEIYLALSFWLINPLTKSIILGIFSYLFSGFLANVSDKNSVDRNFLTYIYTAVALFIILVLTVSWGR